MHRLLLMQGDLLACFRFACPHRTLSLTIILGVVTDGDLARHLDNNLSQNCGGRMTGNPKTVDKHTLATAAMTILQAYGIAALLVVDIDCRPIGIVHIHNLLRAVVV
jgi:arabinose-5-phosphate isomerase